MVVRCKFKCEVIEVNHYGVDPAGPPSGGQVRLSAVVDGSPENKEFFKWTPSGTLTLGTINQAAFEMFELGQEYYIDISPCYPPADKEETPGL